MKIRTDAGFWKLYALLGSQDQEKARKAFRQFKDNPDHPGLNFKHLKGSGNRWSFRIGKNCRAVCLREGDTVIWVWIGTHNEYDKLL